jgi:hypothetical protein
MTAPIVFSKTDRLHRAIMSYLPAHEREENYLPISERSAFSKRKEYDLVVEDLKRNENLEVRFYRSWRRSGIPYRTTSLEKSGVFGYNPHDDNDGWGSSIIASREIEGYYSQSYSFDFKILQKTYDFRVPDYRVNGNQRVQFNYISRNAYKQYKKRTISFLRQNGFRLTGREQCKTLVKMLMSF